MWLPVTSGVGGDYLIYVYFLCNATVSDEFFHFICCLANSCELGNYISYYFDQREKET